MTNPINEKTDAHARDGASHSAEHHLALCLLLQDLQPCRRASDILEVLLDNIISLSWLGMASRSAGFLLRGQKVEMVAQRNLAPPLKNRCSQLSLGECLCGTVAQTGKRILCSSVNYEHIIQYEGMFYHEHAVLPLSYEGKVFGVLNLYLKPGDRLDTSRLEFLEAAANAASVALAEQLAREEARQASESLVTSVITSQENERKRVAQKLHEGLGPSLSAILIEMRLFCEENGISPEQRETCEGRIRELIDQIRQMASELRPSILDDYGLDATLARHIEELSERVDVELDYQYIHVSGREDRLSSPLEVVLYRIAQEALSNVVQHANASRASVVLSRTDEAILLLVEDDGKGFDHASVRRQPNRCLGLIGMEERAILCKGHLTIETAPQKGTTLRVAIPVANMQRH
jgi:signal transduction histidine kinase